MYCSRRLSSSKQTLWTIHPSSQRKFDWTISRYAVETLRTSLNEAYKVQGREARTSSRSPSLSTPHPTPSLSSNTSIPSSPRMVAVSIDNRQHWHLCRPSVRLSSGEAMEAMWEARFALVKEARISLCAYAVALEAVVGRATPEEMQCGLHLRGR
ncbi:hypothetical protein CYLTODRAFT_225843 [Cylindrobasidium torrendii FP15055 ss-10]|uniref:Uncharacterized protein n=1 Tax=Cylindrobasidium torrendii FP15055 ss-10 TaxID=1314674 RepID=A0A0D7ATS8_9AGAR|nr:hypothetical protein CYLTODRAFT_225843 [Cylindrobasidium torrendii FP15055 ss-10]